jgi:YidC/Oxa1 family membrane protein insertase
VTEVFTLILLDPMINLLVILNNVLFGSFGLAIIAFTVLIRLITWPLTLRQLTSTRAMQGIQPRVAEIQKKYSDPKRRQEELMKVYREAGVNPIGCLGPMILQIPVLFALFYAIRFVLPESPEALERLSGHLYSWSYIQHAIPIEERFLSMDLRTGNMPMVFLVGLTTYLQLKTTVSVSTSEQMRQQQAMMAYLMPVMFGFFAIGFPSGVSLYWVVNSIVGTLFNFAVYGIPRFNVKPLFGPKVGVPAPALATSDGKGGDSDATARAEPARELRTANGIGRSKRQNRRRRS